MEKFLLVSVGLLLVFFIVIVASIYSDVSVNGHNHKDHDVQGRTTRGPGKTENLFVICKSINNYVPERTLENILIYINV